MCSPFDVVAVVWYHEQRDGHGATDREHEARADPLAWHCGCVVRAGGAERWALQKFKEHPRGDRAPPSFYEIFKAHHENVVAAEDDEGSHATVKEEL